MKPLSKSLEKYIEKLIVLHEQLDRTQQQTLLEKLDLTLSVWEIESGATNQNLQSPIQLQIRSKR